MQTNENSYHIPPTPQDLLTLVITKNDKRPKRVLFSKERHANDDDDGLPELRLMRKVAEVVFCTNGTKKTQTPNKTSFVPLKIEKLKQKRRLPKKEIPSSSKRALLLLTFTILHSILLYKFDRERKQIKHVHTY